MLTKTALEILKRAAQGTLPRNIDQQTAGIDLSAFKELYRARYIEAIDASADCGDSFLEPKITANGREALRQAEAAARPWWASFDRRIAVVSLAATVLGLAAALGVLKG
jgi:hypothetical protein